MYKTSGFAKINSVQNIFKYSSYICKLKTRLKQGIIMRPIINKTLDMRVKKLDALKKAFA